MSFGGEALGNHATVINEMPTINEGHQDTEDLEVPGDEEVHGKPLLLISQDPHIVSPVTETVAKEPVKESKVIKKYKDRQNKETQECNNS